ncbi:MAG: hypothetical protein FWE95_10950, partial [Planctomycetaceae bacterium]|nr:hypothetical protein [Planctomycetaceae bacterium]
MQPPGQQPQLQRGGQQPVQPGGPGMQPAQRSGGPAMQQQQAQLPLPGVVRDPRLEPAEELVFNFRFAPWKDVIEWFAGQAALSVQMNRVPTGTLNLVDGQPYTPTEALDILNQYLLFQDYSLVRGAGKALFVLYLPDGIPPNLLTPITPDELDARGKYEITRCVFSLNRTTPEIVEPEVQRWLGPQGSVVILPRSQQIIVTETGGVLRTIREMIQRIDDPDSVSTGTIHSVEVKNFTGDEAVQLMRTLLAIDANDASLRTVVDSTGKKIYLSGRGDMITRAKDVLQQLDSSFGG